MLPPEQHDRQRRMTEQPAVVLTFENGYRNQAEVAAPILSKHQVPAIFFVRS
jgi:peptidoglycan/xylan/chitin deacetylase (PgdA/CDA1 family)